ncbi:hypothetical protein [Bacillus wiedmannii]|uniref:hypothetical protein n=1 Tax=Bacillus wiedmannii TaxID=1890302 RepID=UPI000D02E6CB|nr:hypothetical protein [Bacillus wiedmannii]PRT26781.1 hypothetical protein C6358_29515 [Bacillus wiedmannii]PRT37986.1 hypothetical protein C6359_29545 [Bacillus wiedmannii]
MAGNDFIENLATVFRLLRREDTLQTTVTSHPITVTGVDRILDVFNEISSITEDRYSKVNIL